MPTHKRQYTKALNVPVSVRLEGVAMNLSSGKCLFLIFIFRYFLLLFFLNIAKQAPLSSLYKLYIMVH